MDLPIYII